MVMDKDKQINVTPIRTSVHTLTLTYLPPLRLGQVPIKIIDCTDLRRIRGLNLKKKLVFRSYLKSPSQR